MQFLSILLVILLGGCALIFVLYPIYEQMKQSDPSQGDRKGRPYNIRNAELDRNDPVQGDRKGRPYHTRNTNHERNMVGAGIAPTLENVQEEREQAARSALQEVELDFQLGNLAETDYRSLRERYMRRALLAMKSRYDREQELDEAIEEQLRHLRETDETKQSVEHSEHDYE